MAAAAKTCQDQAIRAAVITVHSPLVTREYLAAHHQKSDTISVASLP
jgi:hypothetical protein